jgi:SH3 domain-containing YSC84-like protein 1
MSTQNYSEANMNGKSSRANNRRNHFQLAADSTVKGLLFGLKAVTIDRSCILSSYVLMPPRTAVHHLPWLRWRMLYAETSLGTKSRIVARCGMRSIMASLSLCMCIGLTTSCWAASGDTEKERLKESANVMKEILQAPDKGIPGSVMDDAKCIIVLPSVKKGAVGVGGTYGRGAMSCRTGDDFKGPWSAPVMMASSGASIGFQWGGQATDFVIVVVNDGGARAMLNSSKLKLGADASIAAGPVGRTGEAATNGAMKAQMLSYSRSRGVFAGVSLSGSTLRPDGGANENLYGKEVSPHQIVKGEGVTMPPEGQSLVDTLSSATMTKTAGNQ